ncbi:MAG: UDP-N-acetylmuramoyl-tripeptide--D-alanyl-D-alanine ligase [Prolixibacteraceae bacterium]|nr:UDP-N-acetylmuramoyl-tripeptide--D-alanyl-D-alanine ligase [Prolixibacteraceae bacterium]
MTTTEEIYTCFIKSSGISTDSRKITPGCLFFALKGENFNGNKYAEEAVKKGAAYAIIDEEKYKTSNKTILVENVLKSLQNMARLHRQKLGIPILGITGTNGKTTTKELIAAVLSQKFQISFTQGNLNNHIGVPLTLLSMNSATEFGIVEMGANHQGEIAELCNIADPDYGIITNIGKAHLEGFGSFEGVKNTKAELYKHIKNKNGTLFLNGENPVLTELAAGIKNKVTFGTQNQNFNGELVKSPPFLHIKAIFPKGVLYLNTNLIGDFNFENVLAAACIGNYFQVDPLKIQQAIKNYQPSNIRSQLIDKGDIKLIMDAYNANPTSMQASIQSFLNSNSDLENNYLILGDMLELGSYSVQEHRNILEAIHHLPKKNVFLVGKTFSAVAKSFNRITFADVRQLCDYLTENPIKKGNILIKGSRGIQLEKTLICF